MVFADGTEPEINLAAATATWGEPEKIARVDKYHILIWNKPLHLPLTGDFPPYLGPGCKP
jgi:hypothetical protein